MSKLMGDKLIAEIFCNKYVKNEANEQAYERFGEGAGIAIKTIHWPE